MPILIGAGIGALLGGAYGYDKAPKGSKLKGTLLGATLGTAGGGLAGAGIGCGVEAGLFGMQASCSVGLTGIVGGLAKLFDWDISPEYMRQFDKVKGTIGDFSVDRDRGARASLFPTPGRSPSPERPPAFDLTPTSHFIFDATARTPDGNVDRLNLDQIDILLLSHEFSDPALLDDLPLSLDEKAGLLRVQSSEALTTILLKAPDNMSDWRQMPAWAFDILQTSSPDHTREIVEHLGVPDYSKRKFLHQVSEMQAHYLEDLQDLSGPEVPTDGSWDAIEGSCFDLATTFTGAGKVVACGMKVALSGVKGITKLATSTYNLIRRNPKELTIDGLRKLKSGAGSAITVPRTVTENIALKIFKGGGHRGWPLIKESAEGASDLARAKLIKSQARSGQISGYVVEVSLENQKHLLCSQKMRVVFFKDGEKAVMHYWKRLKDGVEHGVKFKTKLT